MATSLRRRPPESTTLPLETPAPSPVDAVEAAAEKLTGAEQLRRELEETRRRIAELELGRQRLEKVLTGGPSAAVPTERETPQVAPAETQAEVEPPPEPADATIAPSTAPKASATSTIADIEEFLSRLRHRMEAPPETTTDSEGADVPDVEDAVEPSPEPALPPVPLVPPVPTVAPSVPSVPSVPSATDEAEEPVQSHSQRVKRSRTSTPVATRSAIPSKEGPAPGEPAESPPLEAEVDAPVPEPAPSTFSDADTAPLDPADLAEEPSAPEILEEREDSRTPADAESEAVAPAAGSTSEADEFSVWVPGQESELPRAAGHALEAGEDEFSVWVPPKPAVNEPPVEEAPAGEPELVAQAEPVPEEAPSEEMMDLEETEPIVPTAPVPETPAEAEPLDGEAKLAFLFEEARRPERVGLPRLKGLLQETFDALRSAPEDALCMEYTADPREYLRHHSHNVAKLALYIGWVAGLEEEQILRAGMAALLHDVGVLELPEEVVYGVGGLSARDTVIFQEHVEIGAEIAASVPGMHPEVPEIIRQHHEMLDGSGYPDGVRGEEIHPLARLLSIADAYDAIASPRVSDAGAGWKKRKKVRVRDLVALQAEDLPSELSPEELTRPSAASAMSALLEFEAWKFDSDFVQAFVTGMGLYPIGSKIELGKGEVARVIEVHPEAPARPIVEVVRDRFGRRPKTPHVIDLLEMDKTKIRRAVPSQPRKP